MLIWKNGKLVEKTRTVNKVLFSLPIIFLIFCILCFGQRYRIHRVEGNSMLPELTNSNFVLVDRKKEIHRYDVVAIKDSKKGDIVKRVIGLPGDHMVIQDNKLTLWLGMNEKSVSTININIVLQPQIVEKLREKSNIPKNFYFVLGDNNKVSVDSRNFGLIEEKEIEGKIVARKK